MPSWKWGNSLNIAFLEDAVNQECNTMGENTHEPCFLPKRLSWIRRREIQNHNIQSIMRFRWHKYGLVSSIEWTHKCNDMTVYPQFNLSALQLTVVPMFPSRPSLWFRSLKDWWVPRSKFCLIPFLSAIRHESSLSSINQKDRRIGIIWLTRDDWEWIKSTFRLSLWKWFRCRPWNIIWIQPVEWSENRIRSFVLTFILNNFRWKPFRSISVQANLLVYSNHGLGIKIATRNPVSRATCLHHRSFKVMINSWLWEYD